jgi:uncharacterized protein (TIGR03437 family)
MLPLTRLSRAAARSSLAVVLLAVAGLPAHSQTLGKNLIANGDAETGSGTTVSGWTTTGGLRLVAYGNDDALQNDTFGPSSHGKQYFIAGQTSQESTATQTVDLSGLASQIDAGFLKYYLSGWIGLNGGSSEKLGSTLIKAEFLDSSGTVLLTATAPGPTSAELNAPEGLLPRQVNGFLPANVRTARVTLSLGNANALDNTFAADNISLTLTTDAMFGANLLLNGDAETTTDADTTLREVQPVSGWNGQSNEFYIEKYGEYQKPATSDYYDAGSTTPGTRFMGCYGDFRDCTMWQTVDISRAAKLIDGGKVAYTLAGWLGAYADSADNTDVAVVFYDASGHTLSTTTKIGPVTQSERQSLTGLWPRSGSGTVPTGARSLRVNLVFHKYSPAQDNLEAYADNVSLVLDATEVKQVVNAASFVSSAVAPGEFVAIQGSGLGPSTGVVAVGSQKGLAGTKVTFNGIEAFLTYSSYYQVNAIVPYGVGNNANVTVQYNNQTSDAYSLATTTAAPGIFTQSYGPGQIWAVNDDGNFNSTSKPVSRGSGWFVFWATGQGAVTPAGVDGEVLGSTKNLTLSWKVTVGGVDAEPVYALLTYTGEIQVAAKVPAGAPSGDAVPVVLTIDGKTSRSDATIAIK